MKTIKFLLQGAIVLFPAMAVGQQPGTPQFPPPVNLLEEAWAEMLPEFEGGRVGDGAVGQYEDGAHLNRVRNLAHTLAAAYNATGDKQGTAVMLHYLKWTDRADLWSSVGSPFYDGEAVWLSDTAAGKVFRIAPDGKLREIPAPAGTNGLSFQDGKLFVVSWTEHELYELDPTGKKVPQPFGLADQFVNLDGLEILDDGTFLVADFVGSKVCAVSADRKTVTTLIEIDTPADLGLDRENGILFVPQLKHDRVVVLRLVRG